MTELPIIAVVGEPNAGKSTLINKIIGKPLAVTSPVAGTTRDRQYVDSSWNGMPFSLVDTAGITFGTDAELEHELNVQIDIAVEQADMIWFIVDGKADPSTIDRKTLLKFRKLKKPVTLVINKIDSPKLMEATTAAYQSLGIKTIYSVSSISGRGIGDLLDEAADYIKKNDLYVPEEQKSHGIGVSIVGKPNVGKSSILNKILGQDRVIVSPIAGTTRTAIDTFTTINGQDYTFIDTAGLRKKEHKQKLPDIYSGFQTFKAIRRSDVAFLVIDASEKITKQDQHIAGEIVDLGKGIVILANKMDLYKGEEQELRDYISYNFPFLWFAPMIFVSGLSGDGLTDVINSVKPIYENRKREIPQEELDALLERTLKKNPPMLLRDQKKPKVYELKQVATDPPLFQLIVNHPAAISQSYRRYLQKRVMTELELWGTPVGLKLVGKDKT